MSRSRDWWGIRDPLFRRKITTLPQITEFRDWGPVTTYLEPALLPGTSNPIIQLLSPSKPGDSVKPTNANSDLSPIWDNVVVRLGSYYAVVLAFFVGVGILFPAVTEYMDLERIRVITSTQDLFSIGSGEAGSPQYSTAVLFTPERIIPVLMSMFGALALALPVGWVYSWTGSSHKARQGVARALVIMPIAIAFVVFLVKGSLPLAFSLAGIVAAVRFRTSLSETTDAVFLFVVIGIGLAAGVQLLFVAFLASLLFAVTTLIVWGTRFAEDPPRLVGYRLVRDSPADFEPNRKGVRPGVGNKTGTRSNEAAFRIRSSQPDQAIKLADLVFSRFAKEWKPTGVSHGEDGSSVLSFSAYLRKRFGPSAVIDAFAGMGEKPPHREFGSVGTLKGGFRRGIGVEG